MKTISLIPNTDITQGNYNMKTEKAYKQLQQMGTLIGQGFRSAIILMLIAIISPQNVGD